MLKTIIVTGGDEKFYKFLLECIFSLSEAGVRKYSRIGVLDQGLSKESRDRIEAMDVKVVTPEWPSFIPKGLRSESQIGLVNRPYLRDLFPGYDIYIWFDADAWVQNSDFYDIYVQGAVRHGAAVALENGVGYRKNWRDTKWWVGNFLSAYGPMVGLNLSLQTSINIGIISLKNNAAHWTAWASNYRSTIEKTGKLNLDQHAFHAAIYLNQCKTELLPARMNWLPILSPPCFNDVELVLTEPKYSKNCISIIHLAGPDKERKYKLGGKSEVITSLTYSSFQSLIANLQN